MTNAQAANDPAYVPHTCTPTGKALPFGRKAPKGQCPRCDALREGAAPRQAPPWIHRAQERQADSDRRIAEIREHFGSAHHRNGGCGPVCTYGDW